MLATRLVVGALEESGDPNGEKAERGPGAIMSSGFGGLGLEGIVGMSEPAAGVGNTPPGEGNSGAMSGDNSWKGESEDRCGDGGGSVNVAGEDESVGTLGIGCCEYDERRGMKLCRFPSSFSLSLSSYLRLGGVQWGTTWQDSIGCDKGT
ncbi:hypothetical protein HKD37_13G037431 [Glycine soja]